MWHVSPLRKWNNRLANNRCSGNDRIASKVRDERRGAFSVHIDHIDRIMLVDSMILYFSNNFRLSREDFRRSVPAGLVDEKTAELQQL